jgi:hypothetical protein
VIAVALAGLVVAALVLALWIVTRVRRSQFSSAQLQPKDGATFHIPAAPPPAEPIVLGDIAPIDAEQMLRETAPAAPPAIDLRLLGLPDERDAIDREIWRTIHEHLSRKAATRGKS